MRTWCRNAGRQQNTTSTSVQRNGPREMGRSWPKCFAIVFGYLDGFPLDLGVNLEEARRARGWVILCSFESCSTRFQAPLHVLLASRSPLELLAGGRKTMHGSWIHTSSILVCSYCHTSTFPFPPLAIPWRHRCSHSLLESLVAAIPIAATTTSRSSTVGPLQNPQIPFRRFVWSFPVRMV